MKLKIKSAQDQRTTASNGVQKLYVANIGMSLPGGSTSCFASTSCTTTCGVISEA